MTGVAVGVAPGVRRITCDNPGPMTLNGTRTYLVGEAEVAVIDPGPEDARHLAAVEAALAPGARLAAILVTHTHRDHSAGARALAARTGAPVLAYGPHGAGMSKTMRRLAAAHDLGGGEGADRAFRPDRCLADGERLEIDGMPIEALHSPGHISNHLCFALPADGVLFTGDTVMGWATTLVSPPDGDMAAFMATLARLAAREDRLLLPGHGDPVTEPGAHIAGQIAHREARAAQILAALRDGPASAAELAPAIYADTDPRLLPAARRNLLATLIWLSERGDAAPDGPHGPETRYRRT